METSLCSREALPKTTIRPSGASAPSSASKRAAAHVQDGVDPLAVVGLADRLAEVLGAGVDGGVGAEPLASSRFSSLEASPITFAPARLAICTASVPVPPAAASTTIVSPASTGRSVDQRHRGQPLQQQRRGLVVVDLVGDRDQHAPRGTRPSAA